MVSLTFILVSNKRIHGFIVQVHGGDITQAMAGITTAVITDHGVSGMMILYGRTTVAGIRILKVAVC